MPLSLPALRSPGARALWVGSAVITIVIGLWAELSFNVGPHGLTPIFVYLFAVGDSSASISMLLVLLVAALVPARFSATPLLLWIGRHPGAIATFAFVTLSCGAWVVYRAAPLCMDEYAPYLQSQAFAAGHLSGQFPPALLDWLIPRGFQDAFLNVSHASGRIASAYWPSFALLLAPFSWLGIPWICNPLISALTLLAVQRLAMGIFADHESAGMAMLLTLASPVFFANGISYYSMPAHLLADTLYAVLLIQPTPRRAFTAGIIGSVALTLHNPVPHLLFALPWIVSLLGRPGGLRIGRWLFAGYIPLCLLLGVGWIWFSSGLIDADMNLASGRLGSAFALPSSAILLARLIGVAKIWMWAVPGLLLLAAAGAWRQRHDTACRLLTASALATLLGYLFVPLDQGHGWGFRYFHSAWVALPILAAAALKPGSPEHRTQLFDDAATRTLVAACALLMLAGGVGFRAVQMRAFISRHQEQMPAYSGTERRVVIIDSRLSFYGRDLVQNDPWLRGDVIRMTSHGSPADAQMMREHFPGLHQVYSDRFGSVWSAAAAAAP
jgi:hypothetical protein